MKVEGKYKIALGIAAVSITAALSYLGYKTYKDWKAKKDTKEEVKTDSTKENKS